MARLRRASFALGLLAVATVILATACGRGGAQPNETRERAYRQNNVGVALLEQFKYQEAAAAFRQALEIDSSIAIAHLNLGLALLYVPDLPGAAREIGEADRLLPGAPQPPYVLGLIARAENRPDEARRQFERVRAIDQRDASTNIQIGQLFLQERKYADAIDALRRAVADEPYNVTAVYNLGLALTRSGHADEGQRMLERSQVLRTAGYAVTLGTGYLEQGRYAEAMLSTGLESDLVDTTEPPVVMTPASLRTATRGPNRAPPPFGRRFTTAELTPAGVRAVAASLGGGVAVFDFDRDGDLDVFVASDEGQFLLRNDGSRWEDVTAAAGLRTVPVDSSAIGCVAADYDNDTLPDLFVLRYGTSSLYHNEGGGRFREVGPDAGLTAYPFLPGAAALVDVDHDGDLDLVLTFRIQDTNLLEMYKQLLLDDYRADGRLDSNRQTTSLRLTGTTTHGQFWEGQDTAALFLTGQELDEVLTALGLK